MKKSVLARVDPDFKQKVDSLADYMNQGEKRRRYGTREITRMLSSFIFIPIAPKKKKESDNQLFRF